MSNPKGGAGPRRLYGAQLPEVRAAATRELLSRIHTSLTARFPEGLPQEELGRLALATWNQERRLLLEAAVQLIGDLRERGALSDDGLLSAFAGLVH